MTDESREDPGRGLLEALVEGERAAVQPAAGSKRDTWGRVMNSLAVGAPLPVEPSTIAGPAATATVPWVKIVLGVLVGGVVAAGGYRLSADESDPAATTEARRNADPGEHEPVSSSRGDHASGRSEPAVAAHTDADKTATVPEPSLPAAQPPVQVERGPAPSSRAPTAPEPLQQPTTSELSEETRLLARARAHLHSGRPRDALPLLVEHARRFPQGQLTEDRMVLRAVVLCETGETEAGRRQASALRRAFPSSSHLPRVDRTCRAD